MISKEETKHIAGLSRIDFSDEELEIIRQDLSEIVGYVEKLKELETADISPLNGGTELVNQMRDDTERDIARALRSEEVVSSLVNAAPAKERGYIKVKSVF